jgi:hypothetical protein
MRESNISFSQRYNGYLTQHYFSNFVNALVLYIKLSLGIKPSFSNMTPDPSTAGIAIDVVISFILAMIATLIGVNLIGPVATAVGGALKNGNLTGAANSLTAQITLIFVTVVIVGVVVFLGLFGKMASSASE